MEDVEYFSYLCSLKTNYSRCTRAVESRIAMVKAAFNKKMALFSSKLDLNLKKKLVKCYIWSLTLLCVETWTFGGEEHKYLESFQMWCW